MRTCLRITSPFAILSAIEIFCLYVLCSPTNWNFSIWLQKEWTFVVLVYPCKKYKLSKMFVMASSTPTNSVFMELFTFFCLNDWLSSAPSLNGIAVSVFHLQSQSTAWAASTYHCRTSWSLTFTLKWSYFVPLWYWSTQCSSLKSDFLIVLLLLFRRKERSNLYPPRPTSQIAERSQMGASFLQQ